MTDALNPSPVLGEPGSGYQFSYNYADKYFRELLVAKECQLLTAKHQHNRTQVTGDDELLTVNFKNLSAKLTAEGVSVKAWSFISGVLPGAEMIYEAKQEPVDIITVTEFRTVTELLAERKLQLKAARLWRQPYESKRTEHAEYLSVKEAGLREVYLIDDFVAYAEEITNRHALDPAELAKVRSTFYGLKPTLDYCVPIFAGTRDDLGRGIDFRSFQLIDYEGLKTTKARSSKI